MNTNEWRLGELFVALLSGEYITFYKKMMGILHLLSTTNYNLLTIYNFKHALKDSVYFSVILHNLAILPGEVTIFLHQYHMPSLYKPEIRGSRVEKEKPSSQPKLV